MAHIEFHLIIVTMDAVSLPPLALKGAVLVSFYQCIVEVSITIDYVQLMASGRAGEAAGGVEDVFAQEGNGDVQ